MSSESRPADHRWEGIIAQDHAKLHSGHVYNQVNNIHNYAQDQVDPPATQHQTEREWIADLLDWLMFAEIDDRREQVREAHKETFKWILKDEHESGFAKWLAVDDGIYWIQGKPGSGKSTLMKFIMREQRTQDLLQFWTGKKPMVIASFWFWAAGSPMQRSLSGLYRSLLYQILTTEKQLCRIAFPDWKRKFVNTEPSLPTMSSALHTLLRTDMMSTNFFFAIDGLDEYDQDSIGKMDLAQIFLDIARAKRVKLLVSSRPEAVFQSSLRHCPTVRLESMTKVDIVSFVRARLWRNPSLRDLSSSEMLGITDIERFITENAHGVFLWVALVVNIALDGINNFENILAIRDRVKLLPEEINALFEHILYQRIPQHFRQEAFRYLSAALQWNLIADELSDYANSPVSTIIMTAQHASTYERACELASSDLPDNETAGPDFSRRLAIRCHGLLECVDSNLSDSRMIVVTFLHRTLFDYLKQENDTKDVLKAGCGEKYDVNIALMAGIVSWVSEAVELQVDSFERKRSRVDFTFFRLNTLAEHATGVSKYRLVVAFIESRAAYRGGNWEDIIENEFPFHPGPLEYAVYMGSTLYSKETIQKGNGIKDFSKS